MQLSPNSKTSGQLWSESVRGLGRTLVAYSGGVDSAYLAWVGASDAGGEYARRDCRLSQYRSHPTRGRHFVCQGAGYPPEVIATEEVDRPEYIRNDALRCFHCKDELFTVMEAYREKHAFASIAYGVNLETRETFGLASSCAASITFQPPYSTRAWAKQEIRQLAEGRGLARLGQARLRRACRPH